MKKAFTLVELLVAITVIAILMAMALRFGDIGADTAARNTTISRLQRLENALSGYHAAFGTYPPVMLQGSRNIYLKVSDHGIQNNDGEENTSLWGWLGGDGTVKNSDAERRAWDQVKAACAAQPIGCDYPYEEAYRDYVETFSEMAKDYAEQVDDEMLSPERKAVFAAGFDAGVPIGRFSPYREKIDWKDIQLFRFGLLSYLLPRYLFMMEGPEELFTSYAQWTGNNELPCDPLRGTAYPGGWQRLRDDVKDDLARVANIPSQAVCARWMVNFERSLTSAKEEVFFGVNVTGEGNADALTLQNIKSFTVYSPGGYQNDSKAGQYVLNSITMRDGWGSEFFYYSPAPYQGYVVWSAGPNGRTFPPWISRESLDSDANRCVGYWIKDDIGGLRH